MTKSSRKTNKRANNPKPVVRRKARSKGNRLGGLDANGAAYARLLADPCNAAVVHPIYPGGDAGYLFRAESFVTVGSAAGETSGYLHWTPGYVNASATHLVTAAAALPSTAVAAAASGTSAPGTQFLASQARGARCVAACLKVTYPGSESTRSGRLHYGHTSAGMIDAGTSVSADNVALTLQHYSRTPADTVELVWKPNIGDAELNDPSENTGALIRDRKSSLTVAWAGLPAATGLVFHFTAVYEWTPTTSTGVAGNTLGKAISSNTLDDILDYLVTRGFTFVRHAGQAVGAGMAAGVVNMLTTQYGLIRSSGHSRQAVGFR